MKKWPKVLNTKFVDTFELPVYEEILDRFYTAIEIKQEVNKRIVELATLGSIYTIPIEYIAECKIIDNAEAIATIELIGEHRYQFTLSKTIARKENERFLDTIIYHELCHILQVEALITMNVLKFIDGELCYNPEEREAAQALYDKADGHTALWYMYVDQVNRMLVVNPPVTRFFNSADLKDASDIFLEDTFTKKNWVPVERVVFVDKFNALIEE